MTCSRRGWPTAGTWRRDAQRQPSSPPSARSPAVGAKSEGCLCQGEKRQRQTYSKKETRKWEVASGGKHERDRLEASMSEI
eukprot:1396882-Pleurochrysis_carterae.AAC.1